MDVVIGEKLKPLWHFWAKPLKQVAELSMQVCSLDPGASQLNSITTDTSTNQVLRGRPKVFPFLFLALRIVSRCFRITY